MPRPIHALIDLSALKHNLSIVRKHTQNARIMAVIKANAYGHGLLSTAHALRAADAFAVLELDAAVRLREAGVYQPILLLEGFFSAADLTVIKQYHLSTVIHHQEQLAMLFTAKQKNKINVFLKINTGMNRLGFAPEQGLAVLETLRVNSLISQITLMTHFACADDPFQKDEVNQQLSDFFTVFRKHHLPCSLANSAAILRYPETHADWVRPGIMLYGASPLIDKTAAELGLRPVMTVSSKIIAIQHLTTRDKVGYGGQFQAEQPMRIGVVACGYADGYPRHAPTGTPVLVNGQRTRIVGRISMDMLTVDLTKIQNANIGSPVILWGNKLPIEEVAKSAGTISYELFCALSSRVKILTVTNENQ
ncbi:alanine racemase [Nitrosomonas sp. Nm132]|uniref:alanine racemase n=1 Tax=Nitrosomonas sp. Nm132 TaxID=1881053 RepID=UPI0008893D91|nr:alanine racemase [Nitrosomonas sp. Nm132]SDI04988.1 alanine racemase [Nitrosomonas sp. Nm132]